MNNILSDDNIKSFIRHCYNASEKSDYHITRYYMYKKLENLFQKYDNEAKTCLAISHSEPLAKILGLKKTKIISKNYPDINMSDMSDYYDQFDFVVSDQVLEHIKGDPYLAFEESVKSLKYGGFLCHTTCFMNEIHDSPNDFWRFSPEGLKLMANHNNCEIMECGGWGNKDAWGLMEAGYRFEKIPKDSNNPINKTACHCNLSVPIVVWIAAQKKKEDHLPMWATGVVEWLKENLSYDSDILEYGAGGSTIWLMKFSKTLTTIEHDINWSIKMSNKIKKTNSRRWTLWLVPPEAEGREEFLGIHPDGKKEYFENYTSAIIPSKKYDFIAVDGRCRNKCMENILKFDLLKEKGILLLDDSERERYKKSIEKVPSGWEAFSFRDSIRQTTIWIKN